MRLRSLSFLRTCVLALLCSSAGCADELADVIVGVTDVPVGTESLHIETSVDATALEAKDLPGAPRRFIVRIPSRQRSQVQITLMARDKGGCRLGTGVGSAAYEPGQKPNVDIQIPALSTPLCPLTVHAPARGRVYTCPETASCADGATCTYEVAMGQVLQLDTTEFSQWSGACEGLDTCKVTMDAQREVIATNTHCMGDTCWRERTRVGEYVSDPYQISFRRIWGASADDLWVVGDHGRRMHWNGACWTQYADPEGPPKTTEELMDIWGSSRKDIWAVGLKPGRSLLHYDGQSWQTDPAAALHQDLQAVHGRTADDFWAVGMKGVVLHYDGKDWSSVPIGSTNDLYSVWVVARNDVWIGGYQTLKHYDGTAWRDAVIRYNAAPPPANRQMIHALFGFTGNDIWAAGLHNIILHYDGTSWQEDPFSQQDDPEHGMYRRLWGAHNRHVWLVGSRCRIYNFTGANWKADAKSSFMKDNCYLESVFGVGPNDAWAAGGGLNIPGLGTRFDGLLMRYRP